jgi:hypothetical protein
MNVNYEGRCVGSLLGTACGDILGAAVEGSAASAIRRPGLNRSPNRGRHDRKDGDDDGGALLARWRHAPAAALFPPSRREASPAARSI